MYRKTFFIGLFLILGAFTFGQDANTVKSGNRAAEKMMLRSNTRDSLFLLRQGQCLFYVGELRGSVAGLFNGY